nr:tetratricopeptide repeat protein [Bradyrhizobium acaciae]
MSIALLLAIAGGALFLLVSVGLSWLKTPHASTQAVHRAKTAEPTFVGSQICNGCHATEAKLWQASQHRHAMEHATEGTVRGNFDDATFDYAGIRSRFFRNDRKYFVETDGPDGKLATFEIKYTFGVEPLQQYLIEFPDGRIQALSIAWDTRPQAQGGQRWFHLYPDAAVTHNDPLHWTKLNQNWNFMCAECHSTGVHKNYDATGDRFATTSAEISVGCEACHGPGSHHVEWAGTARKADNPDKGLVVRFDERLDVSWAEDAVTHLPRRSASAALLRKEVETCGLCHARRGQLSEDRKPGRWLSETHRIALLDRHWFEADGQIRDGEETYNYAPFRLSKMYAAGVTCSDCHDPHSARLKLPGDAVCGQCHAPDRYATAAHHHHADVTPALGCASCHMPVRSYMVVDRRHDHGFRVPRPDLSLQTGTPNACNDCHRDKSASWAAERSAGWFGPHPRGYQTWAGAFQAASTEQPDALALLKAVAATPELPALVRASALAELPEPDAELARRALADPDPVVRLGALEMLEGLPATQLWALASKNLSDPVRGVRIRAAELLASVPVAGRRESDRDAFARAAAEFEASQRLNADRPDANTALGNFFARQGDAAAAEREYRAAMRLDPTFAAASINLSDLYRQLGRDTDAEHVLRAALASSGQDASLHHALGLTLVRLKRPDAALEELRRAAELDPARSQYSYVYAIGLNSAGRRDDALAVLKENLQRHPADRDTLAVLISYERQSGDIASALGYALRLQQLQPSDRGLAALIDGLGRKK